MERQFDFDHKLHTRFTRTEMREKLYSINLKPGQNIYSEDHPDCPANTIPDNSLIKAHAFPNRKTRNGGKLYCKATHIESTDSNLVTQQDGKKSLSVGPMGVHAGSIFFINWSTFKRQNNQKNAKK